MLEVVVILYTYSDNLLFVGYMAVENALFD